MTAPVQFYRHIELARIRRVDKVVKADPERGVRLYKDGESTWALQIRSPRTLANGTDGEFTIAHAPLDRETLRGLRDAIDAFLDEGEDESSLDLERIRERAADLRRVSRNQTMAQQRETGIFPALLLAVCDDVDALLAARHEGEAYPELEPRDAG